MSNDVPLSDDFLDQLLAEEIPVAAGEGAEEGEGHLRHFENKGSLRLNERNSDSLHHLASPTVILANFYESTTQVTPSYDLNASEVDSLFAINRAGITERNNSLGLIDNENIRKKESQDNADSMVPQERRDNIVKLDGPEFDHDHASADHLEFVSGCRPINSTVAKTSDPQKLDDADPSKLRCDWPGCRSSRTFSRKYELQRHMKKHATGTRYDCPAVGCDHVGAKAPYRADKLYNHCSVKHDPDTLFKCPLVGCEDKQLVPALFILHVLNHSQYAQSPQHIGSEPSIHHLRVSAQRLLCCPLRDCKFNHLDIHDGIYHIRSHDYEDRLEGSTLLARRGYNAFSGNIICPICFEESAETKDFAEHLTLKHMTLDPDHLRTWRQTVESLYQHVNVGLCEYTLPTFRAPAWLPWFHHGRGLTCPTCGKFEGRHGYLRHQQSLVIDESDSLKQHAAKILQLLPEFGAHPIFNDLMPAESKTVRHIGFSDHVHHLIAVQMQPPF
ncbi:hypothetical protein EV356DRAFT_564976 [Viridothelium virens]|uniref:C2H2-type domain-containing protein n=1 Tax=Viridothelium virens TaxID=1048519 RepID=A0A6A6HGL1_VIRVR|nr:hypothetical protein EV356DRAFT_564976 [Viridothelium virens]